MNKNLIYDVMLKSHQKHILKSTGNYVFYSNFWLGEFTEIYECH